jgi:putative phage-type endonuclease
MIRLPDCTPIASYDELTHDDWLALRRTGIGGSDAAACMGMSSYGSPLTVVMEKTGRYTPPDISDKEEVEVGNLLEAFIRREMVGQYIRKKLDIEVEVIDPTHMYRNNERPWQIINPDGFLIVDGRTAGLEIKTGSSYQLKHWGGRDGDLVPDEYGCQVQHYMAGTGLDEWWTFGLIGNVRVLRIMKRNEEFIQRLNAAEADLWEIVKLNDPLYFPLPGGTDGDMDALMQSRMYADETTMDLSAYTDDVNRYIDLKVEIDDRTEERERVKQKIIQAMDRARYAVTDYHRLTVADNGRLWIKYL